MTTAPARPTTRQPKADPEPQPLNRKQAVQGLFQAPALALFMASQSAPNDNLKTALLADSATVTHYGEGIAEGAAILAANDPRFAAALDKIISFGPYGVFLTPVVQMFLQLAANHNQIKPGMAGTVEPENMIKMAFPIDQGENASPSDNGSSPSVVSA